jgi:hypothetical protein
LTGDRNDRGKLELAKLTPEEQGVLIGVSRTEGWDWVEQHWQLILDQARSIGTLQQHDRND